MHNQLAVLMNRQEVDVEVHVPPPIIIQPNPELCM